MSADKSNSTIPAKYRNPVIHDRAPSQFVGDYQVTREALGNYNVARDLFGTTTVLNPDGTSFVAKDYQYVLDDGSVGMTFLPVNDTGAVDAADGRKVFGSVLVDEFLRNKMGLQPTDAIYAPIYYIHPEQNKGSIAELADTATSDKISVGVTHWGSYLGNGRTSNSPSLYHNRVWSVSGEPDTDYGYPANVMIMSLDGVDQAMLNKNLLLADDFINYGVRFPQDYKNSMYLTADLNTTFMFYRDWILERNYLKTNVSWFTYCAVHKTIVTTIGMNLPHNPASFKEVYGDKEGQEFFDAFCKNHFTLLGAEFTEDRQTFFEPLWKKHGLSREEIRPLTLDEYNAYDTARREGQLSKFKGFVPLDPGVGMPWAPQMTSDMVYDFVQIYGDFVDAGAIAVCATIYFFMGPAVARTGISELEYLSGALPIMQHAMESHAKIYAAQKPTTSYKDSAYYKSTFTVVYAALGGTDKNVDPLAVPDFEAFLVDILDARKSLQASWTPELLAWFTMTLVRKNWGSILAGGELSVDDAYVEFMDAVQAELTKARDMIVSRPDRIQYNIQPCLAHLVGIDMFKHYSKYVSVQTVATVMNHTELEPACDS